MYHQSINADCFSVVLLHKINESNYMEDIVIYGTISFEMGKRKVVLLDKELLQQPTTDVVVPVSAVKSLLRSKEIQRK